MGNQDYQAGLGAGAARARAISRDAEAAVAEWEDYARTLQQKLLNESVERRVSVDYVKALRAALADLAPNHPLLNEKSAVQFFEASRTKAYAEQGYRYDPGTGRIKKGA